MFFFSFLCSGIPDLALWNLKMLIRVYFRNATSSLTICSPSASLYSKCTDVQYIFAIRSISYVQWKF